LVDNLPIGEVRERCKADVVIAVNVGSPLLKAEAVGSLLTVSAQVVGILTEQNVSRSLATLKSGDIYIQPRLEGISSGDFSKYEAAAESGRDATEAVAEKLARLATSETRYAAWWKSIEVTRRASPRIDAIEIVGLNRVNPAIIERQLSAQLGKPSGQRSSIAICCGCMAMAILKALITPCSISATAIFCASCRSRSAGDPITRALPSICRPITARGPISACVPPITRPG
jgi:hypothetical protein